MKYIASVGGQDFTVEIDTAGQVTVNGMRRHVDLQAVADGGLYSLIVDGQPFEMFVEHSEGQYVLEMNGGLFEVQVQDEQARRLTHSRPKACATQKEMAVKAPMPGVVIAALVQAGQKVLAGDPLVILESMKMQNKFRAPQTGVVQSVPVTPGDTIERGATMAIIAPA